MLSVNSPLVNMNFIKFVIFLTLVIINLSPIKDSRIYVDYFYISWVIPWHAPTKMSSTALSEVEGLLFYEPEWKKR
jgi:hypothetical protein